MALYIFQSGIVQDRAILGYEVISPKNGCLLYVVDLVLLYSNEINLNGGRFHSFTHEPQEYRLPLQKGIRDRDGTMAWFSGVLEWLALHANGKWSFTVDLNHVGDGRCEFSFGDVTACVAFALLFMGD